MTDHKAMIELAVEKKARGTWSNASGQGACVRLLHSLVGHVGDECLKWPFNAPNGYGMFSANGETFYAHRYLCELVNGPPPTPDHEAAHSCGQGHLSCVNPNHLSWKSPSDNQRDRAEHGTKNIWGGRGKLTHEQAAEIRALKGILTQAEIAKRYGVSRATISWVMTGKAWVRQPRGCSKQGNRWYARIKVRRKDIFLGSFATEAEARAAYLNATEKARNNLAVD